jgi:pilus assembly protein Flp/PilA
MLEYLNTILLLKTDKRAVTALEYGLIAAVIIVVCAGAFATIGADVNTTLGKVATCLANASAC